MTMRPRGLGLGLYIVRHIVAAHGGTVTVDSSADRGTTFLVRLPRSRRLDADEKEPLARGGSAAERGAAGCPACSQLVAERQPRRPVLQVQAVVVPHRHQVVIEHGR